MKTNHYESVVILNAALEDEQIGAILKRIEDTITTNGGEITDVEKWGRKRLAYPIQKSKSGFYTVFRFTAPRDLIATLERAYRLDETVIRYLTIVLDKDALAHIDKVKSDKANQADATTTTEADSQDEAKEPKNNENNE